MANGTAEAGIFLIEFDAKKNFLEDVGNHVGLDLNGKPWSEFGVNLSAMVDVFVRVQSDLEEAFDNGIEDQLQDSNIAPRVQKFGFKELKKATDNFDPNNKLGKRQIWNRLQRKFEKQRCRREENLRGFSSREAG
ncbi:unnamed protein product [Citrullus colocynthis]|uniref:Uncharacterized protein n=1 Tax=Citrullus colocynthis TaxID=252529 RepID=A0ABP0XR94_9ROSI